MDAAGALRLTKHHGAGNDFLVLLDPDDRRPLSAAEVRALCDRHRGIGADGVLRAIGGTGPAALGDGPAQRRRRGGRDERQRDPLPGAGGRRRRPGAGRDGRRADARRVALGGVPGGARARARLRPGGHGPRRARPRPRRRRRPPAVHWGQHVDMGNPHVVLFGAPAGDDMVRSVGPRLERSVAGGANVEFVWPGPGPGELTLRVWERGVGETLACGTGTCAAAAAAHAHGDGGHPRRACTTPAVRSTSSSARPRPRWPVRPRRSATSRSTRACSPSWCGSAS